MDSSIDADALGRRQHASAAQPTTEAPSDSGSESRDTGTSYEGRDSTVDRRFPTGGRVQRDDLVADVAMQGVVKEMFLHAWNGYTRFAFGKDVLQPLSRKGTDNFLGMGITILDAMDTMWIMGLEDEFHEAESWVIANLAFESQEDINMFETTIRVLGGLLSSYALTGSRPLLDKAEALAQKLKVAFDSPTGIPYGTLGLRTGKTYNPTWVGGASTISEVGTLQLEWEFLGALTHDAAFVTPVRRAMAFLLEHGPKDGLFEMLLHPETGKFSGGHVTLGARGDSVYEYLLKQWILAGGLSHAPDGASRPKLGNPVMLDPAQQRWHMIEPKQVVRWVGTAWQATRDVGKLTPEERGKMWRDAFRKHQGVAAVTPEPTPTASPEARLDPTQAEQRYFTNIRALYDTSVQSILDQLVRTTEESDLTYVAERENDLLVNKMDHLVCFAGGMLALGARGERYERDLSLAKKLTATCHEMYATTATGLAPEIARFPSQRSMVPDSGAKHCLLRPEAVESYFILYRLTGDPVYRLWGQEVIDALNRHARIDSGGFASLKDVTRAGAGYLDNQESFFLAETLKYLYLLFSDSATISLDQYVFNTEAHPLPIFGSERWRQLAGSDPGAVHFPSPPAAPSLKRSEERKEGDIPT